MEMQTPNKHIFLYIQLYNAFEKCFKNYTLLEKGEVLQRTCFFKRKKKGNTEVKQ